MKNGLGLCQLLVCVRSLWCAVVDVSRDWYRQVWFHGLQFMFASVLVGNYAYSRPTNVSNLEVPKSRWSLSIRCSLNFVLNRAFDPSLFVADLATCQRTQRTLLRVWSGLYSTFWKCTYCSTFWKSTCCRQVAGASKFRWGQWPK